MKLIEVEKCADPQCPYFKRIEHDDYSDECHCLKSDRNVPQIEYEEQERGFTNLRSIAGKFPYWCPLKDIL